MARKSKIVTIPTTAGNRDSGKTFLLTELDAVRAEKWAQRALLALCNSGMDIAPEVMQLGVAAVLAAGSRALLTMAFADAEPLLDEMLQTVEFIPDPAQPNIKRRPDAEDIEEVATLLFLRTEVFELHTGFSIAAFLSNLGKAALTTEQTPDTPDT